MNSISTITLRVNKRTLLFLAALTWTFAGIMLFIRGFDMLSYATKYLSIKLISCSIIGILFYALVFNKLSNKHTQRIINLKNEKYCVFSFFNTRSYVVMTLMITMGVAFRKFEIIPLENLAFVYLTMGFPLLLSSYRFYKYGLKYKQYIAIQQPQ